jgi:hypothetical protein
MQAELDNLTAAARTHEGGKPEYAVLTNQVDSGGQ